MRASRAYITYISGDFVLVRLRQVIVLGAAVLLGYALGSGPFADWVADLLNMLSVAWSGERVARGPSGTLPLLVAGFLLGQGVFLLIRQALTRIGPQRAKRLERVAAWDPGVQLATRFGLHQYLERCTNWAAEDPTTRTPTLALFKIRGLGALNEKRGTMVATQLLQRIGAEMRSASLPDGTSAISRWLHHHFPRPSNRSVTSVPEPRYAARWSGATFVLAFRELEALQSVSIARDIAAWIRHELEAIDPDRSPSVTAIVALGSAGVTGRGLTTVATRELASSSNDALTVLVDPTDVRASAISQMSGVETKPVTMEHTASDATSSVSSETVGERFRLWSRTWGPALGCLLGAVLTLELTGGKLPVTTSFPWPESLNEVQILDPAGPKKIRLTRTALPGQSTRNWQLGEALVVQGNPDDGAYSSCQIHIDATNSSAHTHYLSLYDFAAMDADGKRFKIEPRRMVRMAGGLTGVWLRPGEHWSGWLELARGRAPIQRLEFEPERSTRIVLSAPIQRTAGQP